MKDYSQDHALNDLSFHYTPCGHSNVAVVKVTTVKLVVQASAENGYLKFGEGLDQSKGYGVVKSTPQMAFKEGFTAEEP